jgi:cytosine/adenosine deaminase-related metal-dependent hydrolase
LPYQLTAINAILPTNNNNLSLRSPFSMASFKRILIKGATVLTIDPSLGNQENCDILIENDIIKSIGPGLPLEADTEIIDGSECIITPGFVDGHHHMWQQLLRTVATDWSLFEYFSQMRTKYASLYTVEDVYFANYAAAVNLLNNGVTCVLDHCHIMNSPAHADAAVKGLQDSGIRGTFCYGFYENPVNVEGGTVATNWDQKARESSAKRVREQHFPNNDPEKTVLTFGISPNEAQAIPTKQLIEEIKFSRSVGARIITAHVSMGNGDVDNRPIVQLLSDAGILGPDLLFSHGSAFTDSELAAIRESGASICATPDTELQMGMGHPVAFRAADAGCHTCLELDITSSQGNNFVAQMRLMLQVQRAHENRGRFPLEIKRKTAEVLRMGTLGGAEAMRLENITGSILIWLCSDATISIQFRV